MFTVDESASENAGDRKLFLLVQEWRKQGNCARIPRAIRRWVRRVDYKFRLSSGVVFTHAWNQLGAEDIS